MSSMASATRRSKVIWPMPALPLRPIDDATNADPARSRGTERRGEVRAPLWFVARPVVPPFAMMSWPELPTLDRGSRH
jgi:hypothetical protein